MIDTFFENRTMPEPNSGCILWTGAVSDCGYGRLAKNGKFMGAHRRSYELSCGEIPDGAHVLHKCDVPCCVNPAHLRLGTHQDNMRDAKEKGRTKSIRRVWAHQKRDAAKEAARREKISASKRGVRKPDGFKHGRQRLTTEQVLAAYNDPRVARVIAAELGVSESTIFGIKNRKTHNRLTSGLPDAPKLGRWRAA